MWDDLWSGLTETAGSVGDWASGLLSTAPSTTDGDYYSWLDTLSSDPYSFSGMDLGGQPQLNAEEPSYSFFSPAQADYSSVGLSDYNPAYSLGADYGQPPSLFDQATEALGKATGWLDRNEKSVKNALTLANLVRGLMGGDKRKLSPLQALQEKVSMQDLERRARMQEANRTLPQLTASRQQLQAPITNRYGRSPAGEARFFTNPVIKEAASGGYIGGMSGGQDDVVPILGSHGEYVLDASTVSDLGDGNNAAGAAKLDAMVERIRQHKRGRKTLPPRAKSPLEYMQ